MRPMPGNLSGSEIYIWGRELRNAYQGIAMRCMDRRFWHAQWSGLFDTLERDGQMRYEGNFWRSENDIFLSYPKAIMNDYGDLVPVP